LIGLAREVESRRWDHTAEILAMLSNLHRDTKRRPKPFRRDEFHPLRRKKQSGGQLLTADDVRAEAAQLEARQAAKAAPTPAEVVGGIDSKAEESLP
jgi:hypothetical protein